MTVKLDLSHRDLVLLRVALIRSMTVLRDALNSKPVAGPKMDPNRAAIQKSYNESQELCMRLFQPEIEAKKLERPDLPPSPVVLERLTNRELYEKAFPHGVDASGSTEEEKPQ